MNLHLVIADPLNPMTLDEITYQLNRPIQIRIADPKQIEKRIDKLYTEDLDVGELIDELGDDDLEGDIIRGGKL